MSVISELSSEIATAVLLQHKINRVLEPREAVAVIRNFNLALQTLASAEPERWSPKGKTTAPKTLEEKSVGNH